MTDKVIRGVPNLKRFQSFGTFALLLCFLPHLAWAKDFQYEIGPGYAYFAGQEKKSLAPLTGYLMRFAAGTSSEKTFRWVSSMSLLSSSGESVFDDAGTDRTLTYQLIGGEFNIGFRIGFLSGFSKLPVQPYFGAAGSIVSASFAFPKDSTVSETFPKTDAGNFYGYAIFVGTDLTLGKEWGLNVHVEQSNIAGTLAQKQFVLNSNRVFLMMFFR